MNSSKKTLGSKRVGAGLDPGEGSGLGEALELGESLRTRRLVKAFPWQIRDIVIEQKAETRKKRKYLPHHPNGLAKPLGESL